MRYTAGILATAFMLAACATPVETTPDASQATEDVAKPADTEEAATPDCDPQDPACDHTGTIFRPPD